jgi:putative sterol carrier protein
MKLLRTCRANTDLKHVLNSQLNDILVNPAVLGDFELALGKNVIRAFFEIVTGSGVHEIKNRAVDEERIVVWNDTESSDITYRLTAVPVVGWLATGNSGPIPKFAVLLQRGGRLELVSERPVKQEGSVVHWLDSLPERLKPETLADLDAVIQFEFGGDAGVRAYAHISLGAITITKGLHPNPDLTIEADSQSWLSLINGRVSPEELFVSGKLKLNGEMNLAMLLAESLGGDAEHSLFRTAPWKLEVNYLNVLRLGWERLES